MTKNNSKNKKILGLHHVTAMASDAQKNVDFYAGILGLRMVKKTINFDAPEVYHLYYGDREGSPGTLMTFFPYPGMVRGRKGTGQMTVTSFSIAEGSMGYWTERLSRFGIDHTTPRQRFGSEEFIYFEDNDGLGLELVAVSDDNREGFNYGHIPSENIYIMGFSQGACLTAEVSARNARRYGGLALFTGGLIGEQPARDLYTGDFKGTRVYISNGDNDPHIPQGRSEETRDQLKSMGAEVTLDILPGREHTIIQEEIDRAQEILSLH